MIKFVSYDGTLPYLCEGTLVVEKDGKQYSLEKPFMMCGQVWYSKDYQAHVDKDDRHAFFKFKISLPKELQDDVDELEELATKKIPWKTCNWCV